MKKNLVASGRSRYLTALRESPLGKRLDLASLALISERAEICPLQDPFRIRARFIGWKAASLLLDEKGELDREVLDALIGELESAPYPVAFEQEGDFWLYSHLLSSLRALASEEILWKALKKCSLPLCSKTAEEIVRDTLWPDTFGPVQTHHVRRAALTAWLTLLRQSTGSCFATAPAMLIQQNAPLRLLQDLEIMLSAGQLYRGPFAVPMSPGAGKGDLKKQIGALPLLFSPGLRAGFHAAGFPPVETASPDATAEKLFSEGLLPHFSLTQDDLEGEKASIAPQFGILWERSGGHLGAISPKVKQIREWEKAKSRAESAFLAIADCALLRCWEYTIASFSDVKVEFARWNLYVSLGLHPEQHAGGIGAYLARLIQESLDEANRQTTLLQREYQNAVNVVHSTESLLQRAENEARRYQLQGELSAAAHAVNNFGRMLEKSAAHAQWLANLFPGLFNEAIEKLQTSFQEVFDPALAQAGVGQFEDSPAGFRLLYKHGRTSAASWERIEGEGAFVDAIYRFFESLEREAAVDASMREPFTTIMTALLQYIRSDAFMKGALQRAKENRITKKGTPWAYESGGTMQNLVQSYFELRAHPVEFARKIHTPRELLAFVKEAVPRLQGKGPFLMYSPTHAFLFQPAWFGGVESLQRGTHFLKRISIQPDHADFLADRFSQRLPERLRPLFFFGFRQRPFTELLSNLRQRMIEGVLAAKEAREELVDSFLYESLPLFNPEEAARATERLQQALAKKFGLKRTLKFEAPEASYYTAREVLQIVKGLLFLEGMAPFATLDVELEIAEEARRQGLAYPQPILFADTNWSDWSFGFVQQFGTGELELWRLSRTALRGVPMQEWKEVFREGGTWGIQIHPI